MSAYVVSKIHIDALISAALAPHPGIQGHRLRWFHDGKSHELTHTRASEVGAMIWAENVRSVEHRYPPRDGNDHDLPGTYASVQLAPGVAAITMPEWIGGYVFQPVRVLLPVEILSALACLTYQSCEHDDWEASEAHAFCAALQKDQISRLPGYDDAPWEIREDHLNAPPAPAQAPVEASTPAPAYEHLSRSETIKAIRAALKRRSGKAWSVTGGRGTGWGWITISAPPRRLTGKHVSKPGAGFGEYEHVDTGEPQEFGLMTPQDCAELGKLLGLDRPVHCQGQTIPSGGDHYREYLDRAEGREPSTFGKQYWD